MERWLFMGNPGSGKSTLANCLVCEPVFAAGLSFGSGRTLRTQSVERHGVRFIDTPGLADTALLATAATEITTALRLAAGGPCKLFFFVSTRNGRVIAEDVATMNTILSSIATPNIPFTVIVNHVQRGQYTRLMEGGAELQIVTASICSGRFATPSIFFVPELPHLSEKENVVAELPPEILRVFREQTPIFLLEPALVGSITVSTGAFQSLVDSSERLTSAYASDNDAVEAKIQTLTKAMPTFWNTVCLLVSLGFKIWLAVSVGSC